MKIIDAFEDGYYVAEGISFLENINHYDVWDYNQIEEKLLLNMVKTNVSGLILWKKSCHISSYKRVRNKQKIKNDYTCILSIKFK